MSIEDIDLDELLDTDDVAQRRYLMFHVFESILEEFYDEKPALEDRVSDLNGENGYLYKLAQEFLTSSSTMEKEKKLRKMLDYVS